MLLQISTPRGCNILLPNEWDLEQINKWLEGQDFWRKIMNDIESFNYSPDVSTWEKNELGYGFEVWGDNGFISVSLIIENETPYFID